MCAGLDDRRAAFEPHQPEWRETTTEERNRHGRRPKPHSLGRTFDGDPAGSKVWHLSQQEEQRILRSLSGSRQSQYEMPAQERWRQGYVRRLLSVSCDASRLQSTFHTCYLDFLYAPRWFTPLGEELLADRVVAERTEIARNSGYVFSISLSTCIMGCCYVDWLIDDRPKRIQAKGRQVDILMVPRKRVRSRIRGLGFLELHMHCASRTRFRAFSVATGCVYHFTRTCSRVNENSHRALNLQFENQYMCLALVLDCRSKCSCRWPGRNSLLEVAFEDFDLGSSK